MGCVGSRNNDDTRRKQHENDAQNNTDVSPKGKADGSVPLHLQPKVSMMSDHTLKLLKEIGELKSFTEIDPTEINLNQFSDFIMALENPQANTTNNATTRST
jgi:hypothetical protein